MRSEAAERLLALNREFYQSFAGDFAQTRRRLQPGVQRAAKRIAPSDRVLDLGCGHGELALHLKRTRFRGRYLGLDASRALLDLVYPELRPPQFAFRQADLSQADWQSALPAELSVDVACAFAVLHHFPGEPLRLRLLEDLRAVLADGGQVQLSVWDFMASGRMRARIRPWSEVGIQPDDLDQGDYLLDWRRGGAGLRYVHHFSSAELRQLAERAGYQVVDEYRSDGEGGRLGLYQIWRVD